MYYALPVITSFLIVFVLIPLVKWISLKFSFVDQPNSRKIHQSPIPLMGGIAIYISCVITLLIFDGISARSLTLLTGGLLLVVTGLIDDGFKSRGRDFPVWPRVIIYLIAAAIPIAFGIQIIGITKITQHGMLIFPVWLSWLATITWVFAISNMINFIDGVDGLAAGIVTLSSLTLFIAAVLMRQDGVALFAAIIVGACLAFLAYNFHPAKIFMGDAGAVFLGYALAILAMDGALKSATVISIFVPILALGVPILDTFIVLTRRFIKNTGLHKADRMHTHHTLLKWGLTQVQTVALLYFIGIIFSVLSIMVLLTTAGG